MFTQSNNTLCRPTFISAQHSYIMQTQHCPFLQEKKAKPLLQTFIISDANTPFRYVYSTDLAYEFNLKCSLYATNHHPIQDVKTID